MKVKTTRIALLLLITATQVSTIFTAEALEKYENASVTPIFWTKNGTALVLLGKEKREQAGIVWCDFFGKKDKNDGDDPLITAKREALEESAGKLDLFKDPLHRYQGRQNRSTVHFIWETKYVDPQNIRNNANELRATGKGSHIEKTDWQWVTLEDLLEEETGLILHRTLKSKLKHKTMGPIFRSLLQKNILIEEEDDDE